MKKTSKWERGSGGSGSELWEKEICGVACFTRNRSHDQESCKFAFQRPEKSTRRVGLLLGPLMPLILYFRLASRTKVTGA